MLGMYGLNLMYSSDDTDKLYIDHVLGRPSMKFRKIQVLVVFSLWILYLFKYDPFLLISMKLTLLTPSRGNKHGPPFISQLSTHLTENVTIWQATVAIFLWLYICRNFTKIAGLDCPEPLANIYSRSFFRATWITTALDAGFWTAMGIKPQWLRDIASLVFSAYYLFAAEQADEKVRRVRANLTLEHMRVSWNKATSPYLSRVASLLRPRLAGYAPRALRIPRPGKLLYETEPVSAWLYFDGPMSALAEQTCVVMDFPGGGFVALSPRDHEDRLLAWAGKLKVPILSIDYKKAPEYPYPYALNEAFDVYQNIVATNGRCLGLSGRTRPRVVVTGDSAGGNLAVAMTLKVLQANMPRPEGLFLAYPSLNMKVESWMTEEQMACIRDRSARETNRSILQRKKLEYYKLAPFPSSGLLSMNEDDLSSNSSWESKTDNSPKQIRTRIAVSSVISYVHDRILTPEIMRALIILYVGPHNRPDFSTDFFLSPLLAPEELLARFPKTYLLTGERDPLVDDTVIFAGRLRQAKLRDFHERRRRGVVGEFNDKDHVEVSLLPGVSHGFFQMVSFFPECWRHINRSAQWIGDLFATSQNGLDLHVDEDADTFDADADIDPNGDVSPISPTTPSSPMQMPESNTRWPLVEDNSGSPLPMGMWTPTRQRSCSLSSLDSEEDVLDRRMSGLAEGLMGMAP